MKTLIENSIKISGTGSPTTKTIFNSIEENPLNYKSLTKFSGKTRLVFFKYTENEQESENVLKITFPILENELDIKEYLLSEINKTLV